MSIIYEKELVMIDLKKGLRQTKLTHEDRMIFTEKKFEFSVVCVIGVPITLITN